MNKKAMFFTLLAIAFLSLFLISYTFYSSINNNNSINKRIESMNDFVSLIEEDLPRKIYISGFRIIFLFEQEIINQGRYMTDLESKFEEAFFEGNFDGIPGGDKNPLLNEVIFEGIENSLNERGKNINVEVDLSEEDASILISQEDPWNIKVNFKTKLKIKDKNNLASWDRDLDLDILIPIENFEDPIYLMETQGLVANKIIKKPGEIDFPGDLLNHIENSYYIDSTSGPSFLKRLKGDLSPDGNGIESLVYIPQLSNQGVPIKDKSIVDYIYFSGNNPSSCSISGMSSWVKLDENHLTDYGTHCG